MKKIIPPFFPNNKSLQKHWWHRLAWLISFVISFCCYYSIVFSAFLPTLSLLFGSVWVQPLMYFLILPIYVPATLLIPFEGWTNSITRAGGSGTALAYILFAILSILPSLFYRLILFVIYGNKWIEDK